MSPLNKFVNKTKFMMEFPATVLQFLRRDDWLVPLGLMRTSTEVPYILDHGIYCDLSGTVSPGSVGCYASA